ncbi:MAG TPA: glutamate cyclase domain-containing protein [Gemmataceae bacterium]|nr:glutamate cyclase domain-containing protein [Gemmataceae bacterium]
MTVDDRLDALRDVIRHDVGNRGLARDPSDNLLTRTAGDFAAACRSIAEAPSPFVCIVTGFFIPHGEPPACETDGPLGAVFLARVLSALRVPVLLVADRSMGEAIEAGLDAARVSAEASGVATAYIDRPPHDVGWVDSVVFADGGPCTHLIALERVGPSHTTDSLRSQPESTPELVEAWERSVPAAERDRCHSMRGRDITEFTAPAHLLFEHAARLVPPVTTIGIGDGGNELGMGKVPWDTIRRNIPNGGLIACRVPADHLIVAGVSNWGAYALAAGVLLLRGEKGDAALFDPERERDLLRVMVERGPLVDGVAGRPTATVDGLTWEQYAEPLVAMGRLMR